MNDEVEQEGVKALDKRSATYEAAVLIVRDKLQRKPQRRLSDHSGCGRPSCGVPQPRTEKADVGQDFFLG